MTGQVLTTANLMRGAPVAGINTGRAPSFINDAVDAEARLDQRSDSFAFLVEWVAFKESCTHPRPPSAIYKVKRQPVGGLDGARGGKSGTDGFAAAGKTSEIMKANGTGYDHLRKVPERPIDFYGCVEFGRSQGNHF